MGTYLTFLVVALGYGIAAMPPTLSNAPRMALGTTCISLGPVIRRRRWNGEAWSRGRGRGPVLHVLRLLLAILYRRVSIPMWTVIIGPIGHPRRGGADHHQQWWPRWGLDQ